MVKSGRLWICLYIAQDRLLSGQPELSISYLLRVDEEQTQSSSRTGQKICVSHLVLTSKGCPEAPEAWAACICVSNDI